MELNKNTIYGLVETLLKPQFDNPVETPDFHLELWDLVCQPDPWIAIAAPRGHAKSTAITHSFVLGCVLFRVKSYVIILSDTESQSVEFLGDIKRELTENENLIQLFGVKRIVKDRETDLIAEFNDGAQFRIRAKGSEQKVRGRKWRGKRPDLIVGDDLENDEIVMNEERRKKFQSWFTNAVIPSGSDDCWIRVVGTILHMDSFLEGTMPEWGDKDTHTDGLRHWSTKEKSWKAVRYQAHTEDFSQMLWPEKFSREKLERLRNMYIEQGNPEGYTQEYLNYPISEENAYHRKEDLLPIKDREEYLEYYVGGDLAISEKDGRAYTVFAVAGLNKDNKLKVVDVRRFRGDALEIINEMFSLQQRYNPEIFFLEKENIARSIGPFIDERMMTTGVFINIEPIIPTQDKIKRGRSMQARVRAGQVEFDHEATWWPAFMTELIQFPRSKYLDQADAFHIIGLGLASLMQVPTKRELEEEEYDDEYGEFLYDIESVDSITGY